MGLLLILASLCTYRLSFATTPSPTSDVAYQDEAQVQIASRAAVVGTLPDVPVVSQEQAPEVEVRKAFFRLFSFYCLAFRPVQAEIPFCRALLLRPVATPLLELTFTNAP
ncbi:hypothetical protein SAMN05421823_101565 [Catalinimonas alkaloidigena]|uniref:Secreted protein n=2 Tax=Catalinimonas alkaloidigena TaxID=1075417 RepID=A0A1G8Y4I0_9BACT|nr:hypothetical protein SAMN05421823_101565 [Catalinimonas alkaloidigena]